MVIPVSFHQIDDGDFYFENILTVCIFFECQQSQAGNQVFLKILPLFLLHVASEGGVIDGDFPSEPEVALK